MTDLGQFSALLDCIYRGATDEAAWPGIVQALSLWMNAPRGLMFTPLNPPQTGGFVFPHALSPSFLTLWEARHQPADLWTQRALERGLVGEGQVILDQDLVTEEELLSSDWYRHFLAPQDIGRVASGIVLNPRNPATPLTAISLFRSLSEAPYTEHDRARLGLVFPHLSRALGVLLTLRDAEFRVAASLSALDRLDAGVLLLDAEGAVSFVNKMGHLILQERDGIVLLPANPHRGAHLSVRDEATAQAIDAAIRAALGRRADAAHFHETIAIRRPSGAPPCSLQFSSLGEGSHFGLSGSAPSAIAFIIAPERCARLDARQLIALYQLTPAEANAAARMIDGASLDDLANELGISINTLKTQVKKIYEKMGVDSRSAFVRAALTHSSLNAH